MLFLLAKQSQDIETRELNSAKLYDVIAKLGWDCYDDVTVEIGGTQVSGIDVGEES